MGVREQNNRRRGLTLGQDGNALIMLITVNAVMFVLFKFIEIIYSVTGLEVAKFSQNVLNWFIVPPGPDKFVTRPWSVLTYMFIEAQPFSLVANMIWLWAFGYILQDLTGNRKLGPVYIYGGLAGAVFFLLSVNLFPALHQQMASIGPLMGAGPAIMAVAVATTALAPDYRIFPLINGGIPLWVLTLIFVLVDFATISAGPERAGLSIAHLAAAGMGLLYVKRLRAGHDWGEWMHKLYNYIFTMFEPKKKEQQPAQKIRSEVFYDTKGQQPFRRTPNITQQKIDEILDKIAKEGGYHFLTDEEKDYLKRASKDL